MASEAVVTQLGKRLLQKSDLEPAQGIIVLPGFLGSDAYNKPLVDFLNARGHTASGWMNGRNTGPDGMRQKMYQEIEYRVQQMGQKVTLIGHSLGGIYARELARGMPENIERVITLGSPFSGGDNATTMVGKLYWTLNKGDPRRKTVDRLKPAPKVPLTSVFTRGDGIINWKNAVQKGGHQRSENIEVYGSHCGLTQNIAVWHLLLDRLSQDSENWQKFDNAGWKKKIYPIAELAH